MNCRLHWTNGVLGEAIRWFGTPERFADTGAIRLVQPQMSPGAGCHLLSPQDLTLLLLCSTQNQCFSHELVGTRRTMRFCLLGLFHSWTHCKLYDLSVSVFLQKWWRSATTDLFFKGNFGNFHGDVVAGGTLPAGGNWCQMLIQSDCGQ